MVLRRLRLAEYAVVGSRPFAVTTYCFPCTPFKPNLRRLNRSEIGEGQINVIISLFGLWFRSRSIDLDSYNAEEKDSIGDLSGARRVNSLARHDQGT